MSFATFSLQVRTKIFRLQISLLLCFPLFILQDNKREYIIVHQT